MLLYTFQKRKKHSFLLTVNVPLIETEHILLHIITLSHSTLLNSHPELITAPAHLPPTILLATMTNKTRQNHL